MWFAFSGYLCVFQLTGQIVDQIYDVMREEWVVATPEESVRQKWIEVMLNHLSFPKELLVVEKQLSQLPHLSHKAQIPERRIDLLAYYKEEESLSPLLLLECKCTALNHKTLLQVSGYNEFVRAPYVAICNETEILVGFEKIRGELETLDFLPAYPLLLKALT